MPCAHCGHRHHIRPRELGTPRVCVSCTQPLSISDVVLAPRRHHRNKHQNHQTRHGRRGAHSDFADAAWAVLIIGLAVLLALGALTVL
jgi:hypothetical protein